MNQARPAHVERRMIGARPRLTPPKPKAWSHQDDLKDAVGKTVALLFSDGTVKAGPLVAADQFTLKVRIVVTDGQSVMTFFKSALVAYGIKE